MLPKNSQVEGKKCFNLVGRRLELGIFNIYIIYLNISDFKLKASL